MEDDGATDEDITEEELLSDEYVDEYPVDDGDVEDAIVDEAFVVEAAEEIFVAAEDDGDAVVRAAVDEEIAVDIREDTIVEDGDIEDETVEDDEKGELGVTGIAPVPGAWYMSSRYGPPQNSDELPLQGISHPAKPSGARPFPPEKELPQS